jgi:hypothetical protein
MSRDWKRRNCKVPWHFFSTTATTTLRVFHLPLLITFIFYNTRSDDAPKLEHEEAGDALKCNIEGYKEH